MLRGIPARCLAASRPLRPPLEHVESGLTPQLMMPAMRKRLGESMQQIVRSRSKGGSLVEAGARSGSGTTKETVR